MKPKGSLRATNMTEYEERTWAVWGKAGVLSEVLALPGYLGLLEGVAAEWEQAERIVEASHARPE